MESPARGIRFIHTALRREARAVADAADALSAANAPMFAEKVAFFARVAKLHNQGEEVGLFPEIAAKVPGHADSYLREHVEEQQMLAELQGAAEASATDPEAIPRARRLAQAVREHLELHATKEEEILVPLIEQHFSPGEQGAHIGKMMSTFTPADMAAVLPWMLIHLDPADRVTYLLMLRRTAPPERMAGIVALLREKLPGETWAELTAAVPGLA